MALEELGPAFIKLGQILSTRPDLLGVDFIQELPKLQDDVPPFPFTDVRDILENEFVRPLDHIFSHFAEQPLAERYLEGWDIQRRFRDDGPGGSREPRACL